MGDYASNHIASACYLWPWGGRRLQPAPGTGWADQIRVEAPSEGWVSVASLRL